MSALTGPVADAALQMFRKLIDTVEPFDQLEYTPDFNQCYIRNGVTEHLCNITHNNFLLKLHEYDIFSDTTRTSMFIDISTVTYQTLEGEQEGMWLKPGFKKQIWLKFSDVIAQEEFRRKLIALQNNYNDKLRERISEVISAHID